MTLTQRLFAPGWYRATLGTVLGFALGLGIVVLVRSLYGWDPEAGDRGGTAPGTP